MKLTKIICNRCGEEIHEYYGKDADGIKIYKFSSENGGYSGDLCKNCYKDYMEKLTNFTNSMITDFKFEIFGKIEF